MEVKIFNTELTGVMGQNLRRLESDINSFLSTREFISMEQSVVQDTAGKTRLIVTIVASKKAE